MSKKNPQQKIFLALISFVFIFSGCKKKPTPEELELLRLQKIELAKSEAIDTYVSSLSPEVKLSQLFLVNIEGNESFHPVEKTGALHSQPKQGAPLVPGGVLLFSYNVSKDPLQTSDFIKSIYDFYIENRNVPPYVAIDQEGGDVNRLRGLTSVLWSQKKITQSFSEEKAYELYSTQAKQMKLLGFHMNLAPVIEVENQSNSTFLDTRTFGSLSKVLSYGKTEVSAFEKNGIATVLKHFPGNSSTDPHTGLPELTLTKVQFDEEYLEPFKNLLPLSSALLMSHARVCITDDSSFTDSKIPATLSKFWVTDVVRNKLGFKGLIFSDDIFMGALQDNGFPLEKAAVSAIEAGIDVIMLSEKTFGKTAAVLLKKAQEDAEFAKKIDRAAANVVSYKIKCGILLLEEHLPEENEAKNSDITPNFTVKTNTNYSEIDLYQFNEEFKAGMALYQ